VSAEALVEAQLSALVEALVGELALALVSALVEASVEASVEALGEKLVGKEIAVALGPLRLTGVIKGRVDVILARARAKNINKPTKPSKVSTLATVGPTEDKDGSLVRLYITKGLLIRKATIARKTPS